MIEKPPVTTNLYTQKSYQLLIDKKNRELIKKINKEYLYWDKVKYHTPDNVDPYYFWNAVKISRLINAVSFEFPCCTIHFSLTEHMQESLHIFDLNFGGSITSENVIPDKNRTYYLLSSIMEEAIASSQMEGAATTRVKAKEMIRKQQKPKNKDQQMILNNYDTIRYLSEHKDEKLTSAFLLEVHKMITNKTLDEEEKEGHFRLDDEVRVVDHLTGEVVHIPPTYLTIEKNIKAVCTFVNDDSYYIHPIIKGIILHFMISYIHPFADGNGRTARALFYWYMLKNGYWLMEYMSISRIIYKNNTQYSNSFLYCENDGFDLGYFINYNLDTLFIAFKELQKYLKKKQIENDALLEYKNTGINERQAQILQLFRNNPNQVLVCKDLQTTFTVSIKTIRTDMEDLVERGYLTRIAKNKRLMGYAISNDLNFNK